MDTAAVHQPAEESSIQSTPTRKRGREYKLAVTYQADEDAARKQRKREYDNAANKRYRQRQCLTIMNSSAR